MAVKTSTTQTAYVYSFSKELPAPPLDVTLLGGKGKGLAEMASLGLPVPPGCIITCEACTMYRKNKRVLFDALKAQVQGALELLQKQTGHVFASHDNPLLVSVRSGARVSMPGMMDTILNLGLNDDAVQGFAAITNNERLAYDNYRRFIMMFSDIVYGVSRSHFEKVFDELKKRENVNSDAALSIASLKEACTQFKNIFTEHTKEAFIQDPYEQLYRAIAAVFNSWDGERAVLYRQLHTIPDDWGTAVIVQTMVFGNKNEKSATGVGFTRDPATGENQFYGEFLQNAQGEEVVAGTRTPHPINIRQKEKTHSKLESLEELLPEAYKELHGIVKQLEMHYKNMQDIEFTIEDGTLYMLQTRTGKRTGFAAVTIAIDMIDEGLVSEKDALKQIPPTQLAHLLAPVFDEKAKENAQKFFVAKGLNAGPGAACGKIAFTSEKAIEFQKNGMPCILVRNETSPSDFPGMVAAVGILTTRGGSTSHAAVVARGMGKPCVVGCPDLYIDELAHTLSAKDMTLNEGDTLSIDGHTGQVYFTDLPSSHSEIVQVLVEKTKSAQESILYQQYEKLMQIADKYRKLEVRANADTVDDARASHAFGAQGIGLCRTEHMFMNPLRLNDVRCMFFSKNEQDRQKAVHKLLPYQKEDFIGIFKEMKSAPVTIRLLDPPLHEFLPHTDEECKALAKSLHVDMRELDKIRQGLFEQNPMLGHRGCRLGITYPELTEMQTRAILEAAIEVKRSGIDVHPEIMVPLVSIEGEFAHQKHVIDKTAQEVFQEQNMSVEYHVGTMIELPRACLVADKIAQHAEFFSFGTNDLTQTTFGISRDDSPKFVPTYLRGVVDPITNVDILHILEQDPFEVLDTEGVGSLMQIGIERARSTRPKITCGICGEHGGEPKSVAFCQKLGLTYVSCSPYRVPIARLAAAQAAL